MGSAAASPISARSAEVERSGSSGSCGVMPSTVTSVSLSGAITTSSAAGDVRVTFTDLVKMVQNIITFQLIEIPL
jgi:hypothetical protein